MKTSLSRRIAHPARRETTFKQVEAQLSACQKELRSMISRLSLAEERERRRIAMEVHDCMGQSLAISDIKLGKLVESAPSRVFAKRLDEVRVIIKRLIEETRSLTFELSSPLLYEFGLVIALERLAEQILKPHGIAFKFHDDGQPKPLEDDVSILLFQAVRELLVNVTKHALASSVKLYSQRYNDDIHIIIEDNGRGFNVPEIISINKRMNGFGLFSVRERLDYVGGYLEIESKRNHGTRAKLVAPLTSEKEAVFK